MSKSSTKKKTEDAVAESGDRPASTAAPVASTAASETGSAEGADSTDSALEAGREARAAEISVAKTTEAAKPAKEAKPSFIVNIGLREELFGLTNAALLERVRDKLKPVELADSRVFVIDDTKGLVDQIVGSDLSRSNIRSAIIDFLRSRDENQAPGWAIASYMKLATGESGVGVYKGNFDLGYLAARGRDVRRGMVSRGQLKFGDHDIAAPGTSAPVTGLVETTAEHVDEQPPVEEAIAGGVQDQFAESDDHLPIQEDVGAFESKPEIED